MCETERQAIMEIIEFDRFAEQDDCDKYNMLQQSACEIRSLENKNQLLEKRINKAIEYIEKETIYNDYNEVYRGILDGRNANELLRILNGESDEQIR